MRPLVRPVNPERWLCSRFAHPVDQREHHPGQHVSVTTAQAHQAPTPLSWGRSAAGDQRLGRDRARSEGPHQRHPELLGLPGLQRRRAGLRHAIRVAGRISAELARLDPRRRSTRPSNNTNGWVNYTVNLSAYAGQTDYIYFGCFGDGYSRRTSISTSTTSRWAVARRRRRRPTPTVSADTDANVTPTRDADGKPDPDADGTPDSVADADPDRNAHPERRLQRRSTGQRAADELERNARDGRREAVRLPGTARLQRRGLHRGDRDR